MRKILFPFLILATLALIACEKKKGEEPAPLPAVAAPVSEQTSAPAPVETVVQIQKAACEVPELIKLDANSTIETAQPGAELTGLSELEEGSYYLADLVAYQKIIDEEGKVQSSRENRYIRRFREGPIGLKGVWSKLTVPCMEKVSAFDYLSAYNMQFNFASYVHFPSGRLYWSHNQKIYSGVGLMAFGRTFAQVHSVSWQEPVYFESTLNLADVQKRFFSAKDSAFLIELKQDKPFNYMGRNYRLITTSYLRYLPDELF